MPINSKTLIFFGFPPNHYAIFPCLITIRSLPSLLALSPQNKQQQRS